MSNLAVVNTDLTKEQVSLIKSTVAKGASDSELQLFLYRCKNMGLDPLKPGQIHFIKYGSNPGTIVVGIDGFRTKAAQTGKHVGTKRGIIRDDKGKCLGAWCEVYRNDWTHPAREEVSLSEYNTGKAQWAKMPETMIKKVAEVAALRMAFPDQLGGLYSDDEMGQAGNPQGQAKAADVQARIQAPAEEQHPDEVEPEVVIEEEVELLADYKRKCGKQRGKCLSELTEKQHQAFVKFYDELTAKGEKIHPDVHDDALATRAYLSEQDYAGQMEAP